MTRDDDRTATVARPRPMPLGAVVRVEGTSRRHRLRDRAVVGSSRTADIVVQHSTVSRAHAELVLVPEGVLVRDLESRNGVIYQGQLVGSIVLGLGGRIRLGEVELCIDVDERGLVAELPAYDGDTYAGMIGESPAMKRLFSLLVRLEGSLVTVLIQGESGVGKELVARALHDHSKVAAGPYVAINCGAIPRDLVASELFGHRRGAFTGAIGDRLGAFERAHGGTLFLDEIGELPLEVQPMLLRALELGEVRAVGSDVPRRVEARVLAATHRDLREQARTGAFREDLLYRIAVVPLDVPPLRARPEDVPPLAQHFAARMGKTLPSEVLNRLRAASWPGNVRELRNAVEAYLALGVMPQGGTIRPADLERALLGAIDLRRSYSDQKEEVIELFTRLYLTALMQETGGNQSNAARVSGLARTHLLRMLDRYGVRGRR